MRRLLRIYPPNQPLPNLVRRRLHPRTVRFCPRHARLHRLQHFLGEHFARIIRIRSLPVRVRHDDHHRRARRQKRTQQRDQRSRRKRFPLRQARRIQNFYAGCFLGFLHLGEFELLRQCFVHGFLYLHAPEQVGVSNSEKRKPADRRISCILYCSRWPRLRRGSSTEFVELPAQFPEACLHGANAHIVCRVDFFQSLQFRFRGDQFAFDRCRALHHRARLFLDVDGLVCALELAEFLRSVVEILFYTSQPPLQKNALAMRRGSG